MDFGILSYPAIAALCYWVGSLVKATPKIKDELIPFIVMGAGVILGIVCWAIKIPDFPGQDVVNAAAIGCVSGMAATGVNQVIKQVQKLKDSND